jgi:hypothetical protein
MSALVPPLSPLFATCARGWWLRFPRWLGTHRPILQLGRNPLEERWEPVNALGSVPFVEGGPFDGHARLKVMSWMGNRPGRR